MYHKAPVRSAPITNAANAMPITVRVSRPWKISTRKGNQGKLSVSLHHMLQFCICATSSRKGWALTNKTRMKWGFQENAAYLKLACFYFPQKENETIRFPRYPPQFTASVWRCFGKWTSMIEMWPIASYSSNSLNNETRKHTSHTLQTCFHEHLQVWQMTGRKEVPRRKHEVRINSS